MQGFCVAFSLCFWPQTKLPPPSQQALMSPEIAAATGHAPANPAARHHSGAARAYRPEIDGLRALAVIAVLINHLNPAWLPGGYLGVDLFFVISGYVVTGSLLGRQATSARSFLLEFYGRRFRRLMPALIATILVVAVLFVAIVHPADDSIKPAIRSGTAALFGVSNLYFLRQGSDYFAADNHYNPFLHTWSLGVEEQFYLVWPLVLLLCGIGLRSAAGLQRRLAWWSGALSLASLGLLLWMVAAGEQAASFYLMPTRFWELAAGTLVLLARLSGWPRPGGVGSSGWLPPALLLALAAVFLSPESWRLPSTLLCVLISAALLGLLQASRGPGAWLAHRWPLSLGRRSYSLYLWHWPVIVLARWSVGIHPFTLPLILALIALLTALSYRLESHFRRPGKGRRRTMLRYPLLALASAAGLGLLVGPARGSLFAGDRSRSVAGLSSSRRVPGTSLDTTLCFREPTAPLLGPAADPPCRVQRHPGRPTLFFEGDSHTEVLLPLAEALLQRGSYNVSFLGRRGCPVPWFSPWAGARDRLARYRLCSADTRSRLERRLRHITPGDQLVLSVNLPSYLLEPNGSLRPDIATAHARSVRDLARRLERRGAGLILFAPLPSFPQRPSLAAPPSLCLPEWYRPAAWRDPACAPSTTPRADQRRRLEPLERHLQALEAEIPNLRLFRPFPILCPPSASSCSTHRGDGAVFVDSNHLSAAGVRLLEEPLLRFLAATASGSSPPARSTPARGGAGS